MHMPTNQGTMTQRGKEKWAVKGGGRCVQESWKERGRRVSTSCPSLYEGNNSWSTIERTDRFVLGFLHIKIIPVFMESSRAVAVHSKEAMQAILQAAHCYRWHGVTVGASTHHSRENPAFNQPSAISIQIPL